MTVKMKKLQKTTKSTFLLLKFSCLSAKYNLFINAANYEKRRKWLHFMW